MIPITDRDHLQVRADMIGAEGERWRKHHAEALAKLPSGTTVIIDIVTGEYVTGPDWHAAMDEYEQRFGSDKTLSHSYTIDRRLFIGGGVLAAYGRLAGFERRTVEIETRD